MADLVTRLLLNSNQFDNNIRKSTQQIQNLQSTGGKVSSVMSKGFGSMLSMAGKFAGGIGLAMGGVEAFNKTIGSSQTLTDQWGRTTESAKSITDSFFNAIAMADFSNFLNGIGEAINKAKEYYNIIDDLGTFNIFHNATIAEEQLKITNAKRILNSNSSTKEQKTDAAAIIRQSEAAIMAENDRLGKKAGEAYYAAVRKVLANNGGVKADNKFIDTYFSYDGLKKASNDLETLRKKHMVNIDGYDRFTGWGKDNATAKGLQAIIELSDDATKEIMRFKEQSIAARQATAALQLSNVRSLNKVDSGSGGGKGNNTDKEINPEQSIRYYEQELKKANVEFNSAVADSARAAIQEKIDQLKETIRIMNFKANNPISPTVTGTGKTDLSVKADPAKGLNVQGIKPVYTKKDVQVNNDYADSLNGIAQIMGNIQGATDGATSSWLNYSANLMSGVAGMITAIMALSAANKVEKQTASGAAVAEGVKSAAQTPLVGWLMVGAAAASVIATLASIPSFTTGGVFHGASSIGDMNIARVNSGEMILNGSQQSKLFRMLNSDSQSGQQQQAVVNFKIKGSDLVGAINSYTKRMSKL